MRVEFSIFVEGDLDAIADFIAQDNPTRAVSFLREVGAQIQRLDETLCSISCDPKSARAHAWRLWGHM